MEFTPFTGLRLRVPLQWIPIQLISLEWYKMVLASTSATVNQIVVQSLQDLSSGNYKSALKRQRKLIYNRDWSTSTETTSGQFTTNSPSILCLCKINFNSYKQNVGQKVFKTPLRKLQSGLQKQISQIITENVDFKRNNNCIIYSRKKPLSVLAETSGYIDAGPFQFCFYCICSICEIPVNNKMML
jgi:hypothetical protein